jgi:hypothetical protein
MLNNFLQQRYSEINLSDYFSEEEAGETTKGQIFDS